MADTLSLPLLTLFVLDELRLAATHRRIDTGTPVFLGPVRTEAFWRHAISHPTIRKATGSFVLGPMSVLFTTPLNYAMLERFEITLSAQIWMIVADLKIVDGSSFVDMPDEAIAPPVYTVRDNDVAVTMNIDRERGQFRLTAGVVN